MDQFPQTHADELISLGLFLQRPPGLLIGKALLKARQYIRVGELPLGEPRLGDYAEPLTQHAEGLRRVGNDDDRFLNCRAGHVSRPVDQLRGVKLAGARYAEERSGRLGVGLRAEEGEIGEVLF